MKKYLMMGFAAIALASCSSDKDLFDQELVDSQNSVVEKYNQAFIKVFGKPAANQDWGFGTATRTRAADEHAHSDWESILSFTLPEGAVDVTQANYNKNATVFYVPEGFKGSLSVDMVGGCSLYNYGEITELYGNINENENKEKVVTYYNAGTMTYTMQSGGRHTVVNRGTLTVTNYANIGVLYNSGDLELSHNQWSNTADIPNEMTIYSTGDGSIDLPGKTDWKAACHIDHSVNAYGYLNIQNNSTDKYFCGIVSVNEDARETVEGQSININIDSDITTSYIKTYNMLLNGDNIFLTGGGYINANKIFTVGNGRTNANNDGYYESITVSSSTALVEVNEFNMKNDKLGNHLGANVYAKFNSITYKEGGQEKTSTAEEYKGKDDLFAQDRINAEVSGTSECGGAWGKKTEKEWSDPVRIIAEDLSASEGSDFDFNDVVFDVYIHTSGTKAKIVLLAAGGTLPLYVAGEEVHAKFGVPTTTMVNTFNKNEKDPVSFEYAGTFDAETTALNAKKISVTVEKEGKTWELTANAGQPAAKIAVLSHFEWCTERTSIETAYPEFKKYVTDPEVDWQGVTSEIE